jgi:hypothetical protein
MKQYNNKYSQQIFTILIPLVGEIMAQGVIKSQSIKIGKNEDSLTSNDMPLMAEAIRKGLILFLGSDVAKQISDKIVVLK